jgi:hypothetical protein
MDVSGIPNVNLNLNREEDPESRSESESLVRMRIPIENSHGSANRHEPSSGVTSRGVAESLRPLGTYIAHLSRRAIKGGCGNS